MLSKQEIIRKCICVGPGLTLMFFIMALYIFAVAPFNSLVFLLFLVALCKLSVAEYRGKESMDGKTVLITGGAQGIGQETALELARRGARVLIADVEIELAEKTAKEIADSTGNSKVEAHFLDLGSFKSVRSLVEVVNERVERLDVLINNAGVLTMPQHRAEANRKENADIDPHYAVNYLGPFLLTNLLLPLLKRSAPSRVIMVSSLVHILGNLEKALGDGFRWRPEVNPDEDLYFDSKLASVMFTMELCHRLKGTGVTVNALHPGISNTNIMSHYPIVKRYVFHILTMLFLKSKRQCAQTSLFLAISKKMETINGKYFVECKEAEPAKCCFEEMTRRRLWLVSQKVTGFQDKFSRADAYKSNLHQIDSKEP